MDLQFDNKLISSFMLFLDRALLVSGRALTNYSGSLYRTTPGFNGLNVFTTPFRQLINDTSVTGANIMSGVWVNGVFSVPGQNGLHSINITEGQAYFTGNPTSVSGSYAVKDFSVYLTEKPEEELLFETKLYLRNKVPQVITGLSQDTQTYPSVYIKSVTAENQPFCLGGADNNQMIVRAIVLGDSQFLTDAACSILKSLARKKFKVFDPANIPLNAYGATTGTNFNYNTISTASNQESLIWRVKVSKLFNAREMNKINPAVFPAFVDFELWSILGP